jgi:hypothetical protein
MNTSSPLSLENAKQAITAGKAILTIKNKETNNHFTYRVKRAKNSVDRFFVSVLTGSDNNSNYTYAGMLQQGSFRTTNGSKIGSDATSVRVFNAVSGLLFSHNRIHKSVEIWHEGTCCRCGRKLTTPESLQNGIGPECIKLIGKGK